MNQEQLAIMQSKKGFIAALDQSGGSTPAALERYGVTKDQYSGEAEMFGKIHQMRARVITSPAFSSDFILGAILFLRTMRETIGSLPTAQYLWREKGIVPFLKIDEGMEPVNDGARLMKPMPNLDAMLAEAREQDVFGTKMRSFIAEPNRAGIERVVDQQFDYAARIAKAGFVPIVEPEVDIHCADKETAEALLLGALEQALRNTPSDTKLLFKLSLPCAPNFYAPLMKHPQVVRVLALSGGYDRAEANELLAQNNGMIASFSRALLNDLKVSQTDAEFNAALGEAIGSIYEASIT